MLELMDMISELCPNGVEYKTLGEIATDIYRGSGIKRDEVTEEGTPCVRYGEIYTTYGIWFDNCVSHTSVDCVSSPKFFEHGDILFAITGESVKDIAKSCAYVGNEKCMAGGDIVVLKHKQNPKYLAYALSTTDARMQKSKGKVKSKVVHSSLPAIKSIRIPVPPLEVQCEIVRILDDFTDLTAGLQLELQSELQARVRQYEYYEYKVLFDNDNTKMKLQDLCTVNQGLQIPISKRLIEKGDNCYRYITVQFLKNKEDEQYYIENPDPNVICNKDDILVTRTGSTGVIITGVEGCFHNNFFKVTPNELVDKKYMLYLLRSNYMYSKMLAAASGGTVPDLPHKKFYALEVPVPTIDEQKRIVDILEKLNDLSNDIYADLPAEIEARQKQYEYYRDRLLTFKEAV